MAIKTVCKENKCMHTMSIKFMSYKTNRVLVIQHLNTLQAITQAQNRCEEFHEEPQCMTVHPSLKLSPCRIS